MSFSEYKERISEGDTVILFLVSIVHFDREIAKCNVLLNRQSLVILIRIFQHVPHN